MANPPPVRVAYQKRYDAQLKALGAEGLAGVAKVANRQHNALTRLGGVYGPIDLDRLIPRERDRNAMLLGYDAAALADLRGRQVELMRQTGQAEEHIRQVHQNVQDVVNITLQTEGQDAADGFDPENHISAAWQGIMQYLSEALGVDPLMWDKQTVAAFNAWQQEPSSSNKFSAMNQIRQILESHGYHPETPGGNLYDPAAISLAIHGFENKLSAVMSERDAYQRDAELMVEWRDRAKAAELATTAMAKAHAQALRDQEHRNQTTIAKEMQKSVAKGKVAYDALTARFNDLKQQHDALAQRCRDVEVDKVIADPVGKLAEKTRRVEELKSSLSVRDQVIESLKETIECLRIDSSERRALAEKREALNTTWSGSADVWLRQELADKKREIANKQAELNMEQYTSSNTIQVLKDRLQNANIERNNVAVELLDALFANQPFNLSLIGSLLMARTSAMKGLSEMSGRGVLQSHLFSVQYTVAPLKFADVYLDGELPTSAAFLAKFYHAIVGSHPPGDDDDSGLYDTTRQLQWVEQVLLPKLYSDRNIVDFADVPALVPVLYMRMHDVIRAQHGVDTAIATCIIADLHVHYPFRDHAVWQSFLTSCFGTVQNVRERGLLERACIGRLLLVTVPQVDLRYLADHNQSGAIRGLAVKSSIPEILEALAGADSDVDRMTSVQLGTYGRAYLVSHGYDNVFVFSEESGVGGTTLSFSSATPIISHGADGFEAAWKGLHIAWRSECNDDISRFMKHCFRHRLG